MSDIKTQTAAQPITLTEGAIKELNSIRNIEGIPEDYGLRIGVKGGGCSGYSYILGFDDKKDGDQEYDVNGVKVYIDKTHAIYLLGIEIDFEQDLNNRGFSFNNPNADDTCGCGTSFSACSRQQAAREGGICKLMNCKASVEDVQEQIVKPGVEVK